MKTHIGSLPEKETSFTMKKDGEGCDGRSSSSGTGNVGTGDDTAVGKKGDTADESKRSGDGGEQGPSPDNACEASPAPSLVTRSGTGTAAATAGVSAAAAATTASLTTLEGEADVDIEEEKATAGVWLEGKDGCETERVEKDGEAGNVDARSGGGSNRAQRTCRRLALKRIRQYVGYFEEEASTPTASDGRPHEERTLTKEGKSRIATPSTGASGLRGSSSSRTKRGGMGVFESPSTGGTRQRGRSITAPEHVLTSAKHANRTKGEKEQEDDVEVESACNSPVAVSNSNEDALSCADPVSKNEASVGAATGISDESGTDRGCALSGAESALGVLTPAAADGSFVSTARCTSPAADNHSDFNSGGSANSSSGSDERRVWPEEDGDAAAAAAIRTDETALECVAKASTPDVGPAPGELPVQEGTGIADDGPAESAGVTPEASAAAAAESAQRSSTGCADCAPERRSSTLPRSGTTTDPDLQGNRRWQQQRLPQQHGKEVGTTVGCSSDDLADECDRIVAGAEKMNRCENEPLLFSSASASANTAMPSPAAVTAPPAAMTLPCGRLLSASTLPTLRPTVCACGAASIPASLVSPTTCAQQHAANLNALMVKSVSPAGVVRRGGRNRRKRTKYDLAYRQMEQLGPFADEAKAVDLSKVSGSSFAVELLKNPELYSYEAWSHGFAWPVGADGRRLLLRKLRGVYWSDPEYWQQRLMSEGLYRRDLFTLATVQELFKVTHLMGPAVWDFLLKCTALTHKCDALTAKDSDQTDGEDGGGAAAHGSSPEALSPNAGPRPVTPSSSTCPRRLGSSSRGALLPASGNDHQVSGGRARAGGAKSFRADITGSDRAVHSDAAAAARALAAAAGAAAEDPVGFSSWLRATTAGVTSLGVNESIAGSAADAVGIAPEGMLLLSHAGMTCSGAGGGEIDQSTPKGDSNRRTFAGSSQMKKPFSRCAVSQAASCEPESSGLELDLSTQQMLDAVAAAVEAAAAGQSSQEHSSQTTLVNRSSTGSIEGGAYLASNSDLAAVLAAARGFQTAYDCPSSSASPTSHVAGCSSSEGSDTLLAADTQPAAPGVGVALPGVGTTTAGGTSFERAAAVVFEESAEDSANGTQQCLSAAAAAAAAADWLGSLQQLLPPVLHDSAQCDDTHDNENTTETGLRGDKIAETTVSGKQTEFSCSQYTSLSVFDAAGDASLPSTAGARMADKLLELLTSPSGEKRSSTEVCAVRAERSGGKVSGQKTDKAHTRGGGSSGGLDACKSLVKEGARKETGSSITGADARQRGFKQHYASQENQEEVHDEKMPESEFVAAEKQLREEGRGGSPPGGIPRTETASGVGGADTHKLSASTPAVDLLSSTGDDLSVERDAGDSSCSTCPVTVPSRMRYSSKSDAGLAAATTTPGLNEASRVCTLAEEKGSVPCQAALRNMMRLVTAAAAAMTAPGVPEAAAATATEDCSGAAGESSRLTTGEKHSPEGVRETSPLGSRGEGSSSNTRSKNETCSLDVLTPPQQQDQQLRTVSSLVLTLATALQQHMAPHSADTATTSKATGGSDAVTEENVQRLVSLLQTLNQHLERQQKKPVTASFAPPARLSSMQGSSVSRVPGFPHVCPGGGSGPHQSESKVGEDDRGPIRSDSVEELFSQGCQDSINSNRCEEFNSHRTCARCGECCRDDRRLCRERTSCSGQINVAPSGGNSSCERERLADADTFPTGLDDAVSGAADISGFRTSTHVRGEKSSLSSAFERSMEETEPAQSSGAAGENNPLKVPVTMSNACLAGEQEKRRSHRDDISVGIPAGGSAEGSFPKKVPDALLPKLLQNQTDLTRHLQGVERQADRAAPPTAASDAADELQLSTDLWMRCMQAMRSSLTSLRNRLPKTLESRRHPGSGNTSASGAASDVAGAAAASADADARKLAGADARDDSTSSKSTSVISGTPLEAEENDDMRSRGLDNCKEVPLPRHRCSLRKFTDGAESGVYRDAHAGAGGEGSGALLLRTLRAYASSTASIGDTEPQLGSTGLTRRGDGRRSNVMISCKKTPLEGNKSSVLSSGSSPWSGPPLPRPGGDTSDSSGGPACSAGASAPSAASLLESTHALLQLKTHYDFMAQFMQCMMLLEVQQALVGLLQSLRRKNASTSSNSRNPSGSSTVRRARRLQRRSHGRKRRISVLSSGNESSCDSSSEPGLANLSLRSSERFTQSRRRRRRIGAVVSHVPAEPGHQGGEKALKTASPVVEQNSPAIQTPGSTITEVWDHQQKERSSAAEPDKDDVEALTHTNVNTTEAPDGESTNKDGCSHNSVQATSTCSSSSAYSSVGRHHRRQGVEMKPCGRDRNHRNSDVDSREDCGSHEALTSAEREQGISMDRRKSTNSSRSPSLRAPSRKCDDGEEKVYAHTASSSSVARKRANRSTLRDEEGVKRRCRPRDSSNRTSPAEMGLQAEPDVSLETFSERDATMKSCLDSLVESLRVQMKFVHVMAGHLQEHVSAAAEQEGELEDNFVFRRTNQSHHAHSSEENEESVITSSASGHASKSADVSVLTTPGRPGESLPLNAASVGSFAAGAADDGAQPNKPKDASSASELCECGGDNYDGERGDRTVVQSILSPNTDGRQTPEQSRRGLCERRSLRNCDTECPSGGRKCAEKLNWGEADVDKDGQCVTEEKLASSEMFVESDRDDAATKCGVPKKRRFRGASTSAEMLP